jgi:hypothetical protein
MLSGSLWELGWVPLETGQIPPSDMSLAVPTQQITVVNPQIFVAIVAGLLMAFAFQLLLTNLGVAIGVTAVGLRWRQSHGHNRSQLAEAEPASPSAGMPMRQIGWAAGISILLTINLVLFAACFLAAKLSLVNRPLVGAILGIVIWSAYFLLLTWISSTAIGSLVGTILGSAAAGFRGIVAPIAAVLKGKERSPDSTEAARRLDQNTIQQEVKSALQSSDVQDSLKAYLMSLQPPQLDLETMRQELAALLESQEAQFLMSSSLLRQVDAEPFPFWGNRQTFVELLHDRTDFSRRDAEQIADQLAALWQQSATQAQPDPNRSLLQFIKSAHPDELRSDSLRSRLPAALKQIDFKALQQAIWSRIDLSDFDVQTIWQQLLLLKDAAFHRSERKPISTIHVDIETFLLNTYSWDLGKPLKARFRDVIYDPEADPDLVRQQLEQIQPADFAEMLQQRGDLTNSQLKKTVDRLEQVRQEVLTTVRAAAAAAAAREWRDRLAAALPDTDELSAEAVDRAFETWQQTAHLSSTEQRAQLEQFDRATLAQLLQDRQMSAAQRAAATDQLAAGRDRVLANLQAQQAQSEAAIEELWQKLTSYLRYTKTKQLTPENVQRKLETLLEEAQLPSDAPLPAIDRTAIEKVLKRRKGLDKEQIQQIVEQVERCWQQVAESQRSADSVTPSSQVMATLLTHLQKVDWSSLNLPDTRRALMQQLGELGIGAWALKRLSDVDWQTLIDHLQQSGDLQAQPHPLREVIQQLVKAPRRWATRLQSAVWDFSTHLQDYLQFAEMPDLAPEVLPANLHSLFHDAEQRLGEAASALLATPIDAAALTAVLLKRGDVTAAQATEIVDRVESIRVNRLQQFHQTQQQMQTRLENLLAQIQQYFKTVSLPELNLDRVKQDLYQQLGIPSTIESLLESSLQSTPSGVIDMLKERLAQFNADALVALLQARDDLSATVQRRLIDQITAIRDQLIQQVDQLQQTVQQQLDDLKQQAQRQAIVAAWWLFCTAITSLTSATIAGTLGVTGIQPTLWSQWSQWSQWLQHWLPLSR